MDVVERKRPRGAFLNLFDWPGKSRKKLFSSNISQLSEESKQTKENVQNPSITRHSIFEVDQSVKNSTYNQRSDSSCCASSVTSDDGNVVRPPSVVARLMGLECLPLPNVAEPRVNTHLDPYFLRSSRQANTWDANADHKSDSDGVSCDHLDSRTSKGPRKRMIERFQTETLPPRSAKPISVTHNKLLSPIRNPGFVPSRNPVYVMEAASRMIEPSPRMMARTRVVSSSDCSSPVPLRIRDLKEKLEAAQKASTSIPQISSDNTRNSKYLRGDQSEKKTIPSGKNSCDGLKSEVKPPSFSAQAKAGSNQKQDSLAMSSSGNKRTCSGQKEKPEAKNRGAVKSQNSLKGSSSSAGKNVLKQNQQKQNCRDNQQSRKVMNKVVNKVLVDSGTTSKSPSFTMMTSAAEKSTSSHSSRKKSLPRNKKPRNGVQESGIYEDKRIKRGDKSIKCNISIDGDSSTSKDDQKRDMDVISFTFSSSIKGLSSHSLGNKQDADSAVKFNVIGGDSLNALLEQKLRELTSKIESSSSSTLIQEESLSSISKDGTNGMIPSSSKHEKPIQNSLESESVSDCTSFYDNQKFQKKMIQVEEQEVSSISNLTETVDFGLSSCSKSFSDCRHNGESDQELTWVSSNDSHQTLDEETDSAAATLDWELEYITEILNSGQLMFQDFVLGTTTTEDGLLLLPSSLFDEMERTRGAAATTTMKKMERKALFDCVNQCLAVKCERMLIGSCKEMMMKGGILLEHRDLLAEEVNREVKGLKKMGEMMIDELVDHDMSCFEGRWIGYEKEMFEEGIDIEGEIVSGLVDDLVSDLFLSWCSS